MLYDPFGTHNASPRHAVASSMLRGAHLQHRGTPACPRAAATSWKVVVFQVLTQRSSQPGQQQQLLSAKLHGKETAK